MRGISWCDLLYRLLVQEIWTFASTQPFLHRGSSWDYVCWLLPVSMLYKSQRRSWPRGMAMAFHRLRLHNRTHRHSWCYFFPRATGLDEPILASDRGANRVSPSSNGRGRCWGAKSQFDQSHHRKRLQELALVRVCVPIFHLQPVNDYEWISFQPLPQSRRRQSMVYQRDQ